MTPTRIISTVAAMYGLSPEDLTGKRRLKYTTYARHHAMHIIRLHCKLTYPQIGKLFNRHHSTVIHAVQKREAKQNETAADTGIFTERDRRRSRRMGRDDHARRLAARDRDDGQGA